MRFLLRMAFWLGLVVLLLPTGHSSSDSGATEPSAAEAVSAAGAAVADIRQFCDRRPEACTVGAQAAAAFGHKARAGAKMLYDFLNEKLGPMETGSIDAIVGGGTSEPSAAKSQNTLTPADLKPEWRGPRPRNETQARRPAA
jgi:hypothetical protein